jgi:hypothetical protein
MTTSLQTPGFRLLLGSTMAPGFGFVGSWGATGDPVAPNVGLTGWPPAFSVGTQSRSPTPTTTDAPWFAIPAPSAIGEQSELERELADLRLVSAASYWAFEDGLPENQ